MEVPTTETTETAGIKPQHGIYCLRNLRRWLISKEKPKPLISNSIKNDHCKTLLVRRRCELVHCELVHIVCKHLLFFHLNYHSFVRYTEPVPAHDSLSEAMPFDRRLKARNYPPVLHCLHWVKAIWPQENGTWGITRHFVRNKMHMNVIVK